MRVQWSDLEPNRYEDMVSVLLSRSHPESQRIDGSGGDGGRDVQIVSGEDRRLTDAFQLKSFTGRMTNVRRRQVKRSLERAAELEPERWNLVVPIDPTPGEERWFTDLGDEYDFPTKWLGRTWLDAQMSAYPDIRRYFVEGAAHEVLRLLGELKEEQAHVSSVPDAVVRFRKLRERLNEIDPYYRYELSTGAAVEAARPAGAVLSVTSDGVRVDLHEKYRGALSDRPITGRISLEFGPDDQALMGDVQDALDYGLPVSIPNNVVRNVTLDAPGGLGGSSSEGELNISPTRTTLDKPFTLSFDIEDNGRLLASWQVPFDEGTAGLRGTTLRGRDLTGWLGVHLRHDQEEHELHYTFDITPAPVLPATLVSFFRWLDAYRPPHHLVVRGPEGMEVRTDIQEALSEPPPVRLVEALAYLQEHSSTFFPMPFEIPQEAAKAILDAEALLKGESIDFTWGSFSLTLKRAGPELDPLLDGHPPVFALDQDMWIELEGSTIPIGRIRTEIASAILADHEPVREKLASGSMAEARLVPGETDTGRRFVAP